MAHSTYILCLLPTLYFSGKARHCSASCRHCNASWRPLFLKPNQLGTASFPNMYYIIAKPWQNGWVRPEYLLKWGWFMLVCNETRWTLWSSMMFLLSSPSLWKFGWRHGWQTITWPLGIGELVAIGVITQIKRWTWKIMEDQYSFNLCHVLGWCSFRQFSHLQAMIPEIMQMCLKSFLVNSSKLIISGGGAGLQLGPMAHNVL